MNVEEWALVASGGCLPVQAPSTETGLAVVAYQADELPALFMLAPHVPDLLAMHG